MNPHTLQILIERHDHMRRVLRGLFNPEVQIDIFRHGKAVPQKDAAGGIEIQRHLSEEGRSQVRRLGKKIAGIPYDMVITSPAPRAIHTALIAISESRTVVNMPFHIGSNVQYYAPSEETYFDELFRLSEMLGHSRYGEFLDADTMHLFLVFQLEMLKALIDLPKHELCKARRIFISNHGLIGSCLAEVIHEVLNDSVKNEEVTHKALYQTAAAECSCFEVTKNGVVYIDYLAS